MAIDIGVSNALTCYDYQGQSHIVSERQWLSVERYFQKKIAHYQAISDAQQSAKGIQYPKKSKRVLKLYKKKKAQTFHILHCMTKKVIELAARQGVKTIVVGDLTGIREKSELGGKNNQKFHALPIRKLAQMIKYKAEEVGITFDTQTDEYTSQTCAFCKPFASKEYANKSNRIHRGLYHCKECDTLVNADVNGSMNISKKYLKVLEAQSVVVLGTPKVYTFNGQQFVM
jgi:putative transposase